GKLSEARLRHAPGGIAPTQALRVLAAVDKVRGFSKNISEKIYSSAEQEKRQLLLELLFLVSLILLLCAAAGHLMFKYWVQPLRRLTAVVNRYGHGELEARCSYASASELGTLSAAFNFMADTILSGKALKEKSEELLRNQALLNSLVESAADAIYIKDMQGRYLVFNRAAEAVTGRKASDVLGRDDRFVFPEAEARAIIERDKDARLGTGTYEETVTTGAGGKAVFLTTKGPVRDAAGKVVGIFGVARDITESKLMEGAIKNEEARLREVLDSSPFPVAVVRPLRGLRPAAAAHRRHAAVARVGEVDQPGAARNRCRRHQPDHRRHRHLLHVPLHCRLSFAWEPLRGRGQEPPWLLQVVVRHRSYT
ncbi:MAG TPA: PAS domain S-box protein, partial [Elusimicrobiales bacterium]|nr:PAS domain S-box protein [Elusimicrobiales bacterium]